MKKNVLLGLFLITGLQADQLPAGSYKNCYNCSYENGKLSCQCCEKTNPEEWEVCKIYDDKGQFNRILDRSTSKSGCPIGYKNNNGKLECSNETSKTPVKK